MKQVEFFKIFFIIFLIFFIAGTAASFSFGSVAYDTDKTTEKRASFEIGLINLNDEPLQINFTTQGLENTEIRRNFRIEPSETARNPAGDGWISIGNGEYAKPHSLEFEADFQQSREFTARLEASRVSETGEERINPLPVQVREHTYSVVVPEQTGAFVDRGFDRDSSEGEQQVQENGDSGDQPTSETENPGMNIGSSQTDETVNSNETQNQDSASTIEVPGEQNQNNGGFDLMTPLLAIAAAGSLLYLWRIL